MERCPNCRARYRGGASCHRCGMELELLIRIERQASALRGEAAQRLLEGKSAQAATAIRQARLLRDDPLLARLAKTLEGSARD